MVGGGLVGSVPLYGSQPELLRAAEAQEFAMAGKSPQAVNERSFTDRLGDNITEFLRKIRHKTRAQSPGGQ